jgi:hypothetical protein
MTVSLPGKPPVESGSPAGKTLPKCWWATGVLPKPARETSVAIPSTNSNLLPTNWNSGPDSEPHWDRLHMLMQLGSSLLTFR